MYRLDENSYQNPMNTTLKHFKSYLSRRWIVYKGTKETRSIIITFLIYLLEVKWFIHLIHQPRSPDEVGLEVILELPTPIQVDLQHLLAQVNHGISLSITVLWALSFVCSIQLLQHHRYYLDEGHVVRKERELLFGLPYEIQEWTHLCYDHVRSRNHQVPLRLNLLQLAADVNDGVLEGLTPIHWCN